MTEEVKTTKKPKADKYPGINAAELKRLIKKAEKDPGSVCSGLLENAKGYLALLAKEK
jgi:hypothetical protein